MTTATADPIVGANELLATTRGPRPTDAAAPLGPPVSFGFARLRPVVPAGAQVLDGATYDPLVGLTIDPTTGGPAVFTPELKTKTNYDTVEDTQKWNDTEDD